MSKEKKTFEEPNCDTPTDTSTKSRRNNHGRRSGNSKSGGIKNSTRAHNDPAWYNHSPGLVESSASIPFVNFTGIPLNIGGDIPYVIENGYTLPGICVVKFSPSCGVAESKEDAPNVMSNKTYADMRRWNSGSRNYESPDYSMHLLAIDSAFMLWAEAVRTYGLINKYVVDNRYTPKRMFEAMGLDYDELSSNMANFRTYINTYAAKLNTCPLPKIWDLTKRHIFMCSNVYTDHTNSKSQFYIFKPNYVYKLDVTNFDTGTALVPVNFAQRMTSTDYRDMFNEVIDSLLTDEDASIMAGDTLKAFGDCWQLESIPEDYHVDFTYDEQMLSQIHNASILSSEVTAYPITGYDGPTDTRTIYQKDGVLLHTPYIMIQNGSSAEVSAPVDGGHVLDFHGDKQPTPLDIMYISRLQAVISNTVKINVAGVDTYSAAKVISCGTEYITSVDLYTINADSGILYKTNVPKFLNSNATTVKTLSELTQFKWHPRVLVVNETTAPDGSFTITDQFWESKNIGVLSKQNIANMNDVALLSLLDLPINK